MTWIKRAEISPTEIGECPTLEKWGLVDAVNALKTGTNKYSVDDLFTNISLSRDISGLMIWANSGVERILRVIQESVESNPAEIARISKGLHYINEEVTPYLNFILNSKSVHDNHFPNYPQLRALFYALASIRMTDASLEKAMKIASKPFSEPIVEMHTQNAQRLIGQGAYNISEKREFSNVVIRELMQNATDACNKKMAETGQSCSVWIDIKTPSVAGGEVSDVNGNIVTLCDIICRDNGVGMTWDTVRKKFFVLLESGKRGDANATGGFGAASGVITDTPQHGWTIETNGVAGSRGSKHAYFALAETQKALAEKSKGHPLGKFHPTMSSTGTSVTLLGMATPHDGNIRSMMEKYTIGSTVSFYFNGKIITPKYDISTFSPLSDNIEDIASVALKGSRDQIVDLAKMDLVNKGNTLEGTGYIGGTKKWEYEGGKFVSIRLLVSPVDRDPNGVQVYSRYPQYLLNNQFQFDGSNSIANLNMIIDVKTNIRPLEPNYPVSTGRDSLISVFRKSVEDVIDKVRVACTSIAENKLLLKGTITTVLNKSLPGLSIHSANKRGRISDQLKNAPDGTTAEKWLSYIEKMREDGQSDEGRGIGDQSKAVIEMLMNKDKSRHVTAEEIDEMFQITEFPVSICIEKDYLPSELVHANRGAWLSSIVLWSFTLKTLMKAVEPYVKSTTYNGVNQEMIPGIVISKECLGLYNPPVDKEDQLAQVSVNPLMICNMLFPEEMDKAVRGVFDPRTNLSTRYSIRLEEKMGISLFHTAVHELTHFYFPDSYSGSSRFHDAVTHLEFACHNEWVTIRNKIQDMSEDIAKDCYSMLQIINQDAKSERQGRISEVPTA